MKGYITIAAMMLINCAIADHGSEAQYAEVTRVEAIYEEIAYDKPREHCWDETVHSKSCCRNAMSRPGCGTGCR